METVSFVHMASSATIAACMAEVLTLPIDTAKVRMQVAGSVNMTGEAVAAAIRPIPSCLIPLLAQMAKHEGISAWWKGLPAGLHRQCIYASLRSVQFGTLQLMSV